MEEEELPVLSVKEETAEIITLDISEEEIVSLQNAEQLAEVLNTEEENQESEKKTTKITKKRKMPKWTKKTLKKLRSLSSEETDLEEHFLKCVDWTQKSLQKVGAEAVEHRRKFVETKKEAKQFIRSFQSLNHAQTLTEQLDDIIRRAEELKSQLATLDIRAEMSLKQFFDLKNALNITF